MSSDYQQVQALVQLYQDNSANIANDANGIWDDLLKLIEELVQKILNTSIGANGQTISQLIDSVKNKIGGVVTEVKYAINGITTDIKTALTGSFVSLKAWFQTITDAISTKVDDVITGINEAVTSIVDSVTNNVTDIIDGIKDGITDAIEALKNKIGEIVQSLKDIGETIGEWISNAIDNVGTWISDTATNIVNSVKGWLRDVYQSVSDTATTIVNALKDKVAEVYNNVKEWLTTVYQSISDTATRLVQGIKDTYESTKKTVVGWLESAVEFLHGIANNIEYWFKVTWEKVVSWWETTVTPNIEAVKKIPAMIKDIVSRIWEFIEKGDFSGLFDAIDGIFKSFGLPAPLEIVQGILTMVAYFWETIRLQFVPMEVAAQKNANISLALDPIADGVAANGVYRGLWGEDDFFSNAALGGVARSRAKVSLETNRPLPTPGQAQQLFLRGEISENEHDTLLANYGFSNEHISEIKALYQIIPGVQDIIRMAVREAFTPDIAARFGQYEDLPQAFIAWAAKQGLNEDWAARYWAAHWDLPSPNMGFEMFQRRIISKDDLSLLLRALDVMPFWREKLIELSYNPLTRVDVRRMYKMGVITEEQVYNAHLDIGYSPDNARLLTEFTKRYSSPESTSQVEEFSELARSTYSQAYRNRIISTEEYREFLKGLKYVDEDISLLISLDDYAIIQKDQLFDPIDYRKTYLKLVTAGYTRGLFNREDAKDILIQLDFTDEQSELELNLIDYNRTVGLKDVLVQQLHNQYVSFIIDDVELHSIMDTFGYYADEVDRLIEEWGIERSFRDKRPSITDLKKFYAENQFTLEEYLNELRGIGYHEKYIAMYEKSLSRAKG